MSERERIKETREWAKDLRNDASLCPDFIKRVIKRQAAERFLLIVDQFEELYTLSSDEQEQHAFLDALLAALRAAAHQGVPSLRLVLTLRADFVGQTTSYKPLADALQEASFFVGPMGRAELGESYSRASPKTPRAGGRGAEHPAVGGGRPGHQRPSFIRVCPDPALVPPTGGPVDPGRLRGDWGSQEALSRHAEDAWARLNAEEQRQAQALFTRCWFALARAPKIPAA